MLLILSFSYNTLVACIYMLNTYCLGYVICEPLIKNNRNYLFKNIIRWAVGWNVLVFLVHMLGLLSVLNLFVYILLLTSGLTLCLIRTPKDFVGVYRERKKLLSRFREVLAENKFAIGLLVVFILMMYLISLAPVSKTDELNYYYYFVKRIVTQGALKFDYFQVFSFQPMPQQLWYVPAYGLGATEAPAILNLFTSFLIIFVSYSWVIRYTKSKFALIAILATYINLSAVSNYPAPQDNVACWLWGLVALVMTYEFLYSDLSQKDTKLQSLSLGIVYVTACLVKLTNLPLIFLCLLAVFYKAYTNKLEYKQLCLFFIPFLVLYTPFLIRIYIWTGNPFFPVLSKLFGSTVFDVNAMNVYFQRPALHWSNNVVDNLYYLFRMFRHSFLFNLSPILILVSPIGLFYLLSRKKKLIGILITIYFTIWFFSPASSRLLAGFLTFVVLTLFAQDLDLVKNRYVIGIVKLQALFIICITIFYFTQFGKYVFGFESKAEFLNTKVQTYKEIEWVNSNLPQGSRILTNMREKYYFDCPVYTLSEYPLVMGEDARKKKTLESIHQLLKRHGITHLFFAGSGKRFNREFSGLLSQVGEKYGSLIYTKNQATVRGVRHPLRKPMKGRVIIYELKL